MPVILLIDEHSVYRIGLQRIIEMTVENSTIIDATSLHDTREATGCDLILVDSRAVSKASMHLLKALHDTNPSARMAILSSSNARADVLNSLSAGFHGFIYKMQPEKEIVRAVHDLLSGRIYVPPWIADGEDGQSALPPSAAIDEGRLKLTPRQCEILPLLAQGMSNKEIALHLHIAEGTAKLHTAALLKAMRARNRTEAAFMAARLVSRAAQPKARPGTWFALNGSAESGEAGTVVRF
ncbi:response regulator transcription factor [uncultured Methylobacterium sp.]|uniref:LuxR C-terminal-related transcriptional regulator n=1 Tax=uncultured Methylobacterium sp. TaxID=157278 RepID=UPI002628B208|nr:response regulator transcription factor [uncultured Methylobacterium sp.]